MSEQDETPELRLVGEAIGSIVAHATEVHDQVTARLGQFDELDEDGAKAVAVAYVHEHEEEIALLLLKLGAASALVIGGAGVVVDVALMDVPSEDGA